MPWLVREGLAMGLAALFATIVVATQAGGSDNISFFIAIIGSLAIWEGARYALKAGFAGK